jgi:hypothetical protein
MRYWSLALAVLGASLVCPPQVVQADQALVIGINSYPNLPSTAQLAGADNDAVAMAGKLHGLGYTVHVLTDANATKSQVLAALTKMKDSVKPQERLVVYFAGHGAEEPGGEGVLLTSDANPADQSNYITSGDLYSAVCAIPAAARTIILDSCFSGALTRDLSPTTIHRKPRFYNFFGVDKKGFDPASSTIDEESSIFPEADAQVCYFVASGFDQVAYEDEFGSQSAGVFTHFFLKDLANTSVPWSPVQSAVTADVQQFTGTHQSPELSPGYGSTTVFSRLNATHSTVQSIWETFSDDRADFREIRLEINPRTPSIETGQKFSFTIRIGDQGGYVVLLELDTDGNLNLLYPPTSNYEHEYTSAGSITFPSDPATACTVSKPGIERVRAILFDNKSDMEALLQMFPPDRVITSLSAAETPRFFTPKHGKPIFYTSEIRFEVVDPKL